MIGQLVVCSIRLLLNFVHYSQKHSLHKLPFSGKNAEKFHEIKWRHCFAHEPINQLNSAAFPSNLRIIRFPYGFFSSLFASTRVSESYHRPGSVYSLGTLPFFTMATRMKVYQGYLWSNKRISSCFRADFVLDSPRKWISCCKKLTHQAKGTFFCGDITYIRSLSSSNLIRPKSHILTVWKTFCLKRVLIRHQGLCLDDSSIINNPIACDSSRNQ